MQIKSVLPTLCGTDERHAPDFKIDRACDPFHSVLFLYFRSEIQIRTKNGIETAYPGDCIFHTPDFPQYHATMPGAKEGYRNDWIHVGPELILPLLKKYKLPCNVLLHTGQMSLSATFIQSIRREAILQEFGYNTMIQLLLEQMILMIRRYSCSKPCSRVKTRTEKIYHTAMMEFRNNLYDHPEQDLSIEFIAGKMKITRGRFTAIYQSFFGGSTPYADLMKIRMEKAKTLLLNTSFSVKEIAALCGWNDAHFFMRTFRIKNGVTPSQFRAGITPVHGL